MVGKAAILPGHESQFQAHIPGAGVGAAVAAPQPFLMGGEIRGKTIVGVGRGRAQKGQQFRYGGQPPVPMASPSVGIQVLDVACRPPPVQRIVASPVLPQQAGGGVQKGGASFKALEAPAVVVQGLPKGGQLEKRAGIPGSGAHRVGARGPARMRRAFLQGAVRRCKQAAGGLPVFRPSAGQGRQVVGHGRGVRIACGGPPGEASCQKGIPVGGQLRIEAAGRLGRILGQAAGEHAVDHNPDRIEIGGAIDPVMVFLLLGGGVEGGSHFKGSRYLKLLAAQFG